MVALARGLAVGIGPAEQPRLVAARPGRLGAVAVERVRVVGSTEVLGPQDAAVADQAREAPGRERAAAEAEEVEVVAGHVVLGEIAVRGEDVVREADADRAAADAVDRAAGPDAALVEDALLGRAVVLGDRVGELGDVARRDLVAVDLVGAVPGAVAGDDDALAHRPRSFLSRSIAGTSTTPSLVVGMRWGSWSPGSKQRETVTDGRTVPSAVRTSTESQTS